MFYFAEPKAWWASKTIWVGAMLVLLGSLQLLPPHPLVTAGIGLLMIGLRLITGRELYLWRRR